MSDVSPDENNRNPFTRPGFIISAALVLALIAAVIVIAFIPRGGDEPDAGSTEPTTTETTSAPSATPAGVEESVCGLPSSDDTALGTAPESNWELAGTMAIPVAPETHGPGVVDDAGFRTCFAHSPTGALYAAASLWAESFNGDPERVYTDLTADSRARDELLAQIEAGEQVGSQGEQSIQVQGFQLQRYDGDIAVVDLAVENDQGAFISLPTPMRWEDGDWKLIIPETGNPGFQQLNNLSDYIPWSGV